MVKLSPRETEILQLVTEGMLEKQIADVLGITVHTVKTHKKHLYEKTNTRGQVALSKYMAQQEIPPPTIDSLAGYWLSQFDFESHIPSLGEARYRKGEQINLELIKATKDEYFKYEGSNVCGARAESSRFYEHQFRICIVDNIAVGIWKNDNSHNVGCFQLFVHNNGLAMHGAHLGNTSNGVVKMGRWLWLKVEAPENPIIDPDGFRRFEEVAVIAREVCDTGRLLRIDELFR